MAKQPNILFLFADDQRFDTIHALGNHEIVTPTLDRLVDKGVTFSNAYIMGGSCLAVCMPSRAMLMTGRTLFHIEGRGETIPPAHSMLPEMFRRAGYTTFGTGKWHNGTASYARAFSAGAEIFFGGMDDHWNVPVCDFRSDGRYPEPVRRTSICGGREMTWRRQYHHYRKGRHSTDLFADATAAFLQSYDAATPFFAYVAFMAPHDPRETHPRYHAMYDPQQIRLPDNFMTEHPFDNGEIDGRDELLAARPRQPEEIRRHIAEY